MGEFETNRGDQRQIDKSRGPDTTEVEIRNGLEAQVGEVEGEKVGASRKRDGQSPRQQRGHHIADTLDTNVSGT